MRPSVARIVDVASYSFNVSPEVMLRPDGLGQRNRRVARARQAAMYVARKTVRAKPNSPDDDRPISLPELGNIFHRDHTTVLHAIREVERLCKSDVAFARKVSTLEAKFSVDAKSGTNPGDSSNRSHDRSQAIHRSATYVLPSDSALAEA